VPVEGLEAGDVGTVAHIYRDGLAYEVEFTTLDGKTAAVVTLEAAHVRLVGKHEITHAQELVPRWSPNFCWGRSRMNPLRNFALRRALLDFGPLAGALVLEVIVF